MAKSAWTKSTYPFLREALTLDPSHSPYELVASGLTTLLKLQLREPTRLVDELLLFEAEVKYIAGFHALVILIAIFGASVTFPLMVTPIAEPPNPDNVQIVRILLS